MSKIDMTKTQAIEYLVRRADELGYTMARLEDSVRRHSQTLDDITDAYAYEQSRDWDWKSFWQIAAIGFDVPNAAYRRYTMFAEQEPINYDDGCRGC